ncbi:MAG TPA: HEPN domain-containing protein [Phenylobacterium sp.]|nr:HEPN domain-containing protein [Phenylobacterium sp.]
MGAAEVLHRGLGIAEPPIPADEFKPMREAMLAAVPAMHRKRFKEAIRNDPTLRDRLCALAARPDTEAVGLLVPDVERWAERTTRARNDLAHGGRTPKHSIEELIAVVEATTAIVIRNVLHELGLPAERQREIVREHPQLRATARSAAPSSVRTRPSADDAHDIVYFRRHVEDDAEEAVPGRNFLRRCPPKVRATMAAVLTQVAAAPPKRFAGGGYWEAMKDAMTGWFEVRVDGPGRHHASWTTRRKVEPNPCSSWSAVSTSRSARP